MNREKTSKIFEKLWFLKNSILKVKNLQLVLLIRYDISRKN